MISSLAWFALFFSSLIKSSTFNLFFPFSPLSLLFFVLISLSAKALTSLTSSLPRLSNSATLLLSSRASPNWILSKSLRNFCSWMLILSLNPCERSLNLQDTSRKITSRLPSAFASISRSCEAACTCRSCMFSTKNIEILEMLSRISSLIFWGPVKSTALSCNASYSRLLTNDAAATSVSESTPETVLLILVESYSIPSELSSTAFLSASLALS